MEDKQTVPNQTTEPEQPIEPSTQATMIAGEMNAASAQPNTPIEQQPVAAQVNQFKKPSKWRYVFIVLISLQILGVLLFVLESIELERQASEGMAALGLVLFVTVVPAIALLALINVIGLPIYIKKQKPRGKGLVFWITSFVISLCLVLYGLYGFSSFFLSSSEADRLDNAAIEQTDQEFTDTDDALLSTE